MRLRAHGGNTLSLVLVSSCNSWYWVPCRRDLRTLAAKIRSHEDTWDGRAQLLQHLDCLDHPPDPAAFAPLLQTCSQHQASPEGKLVHAHILMAGLQHDLYLSNYLITMYGNCGSLDDARNVFDQMHHRDVVSWTAMIGVFAHVGYSAEAFLFLQHMQMKHVRPNYVTFLTVLNTCECPAELARGRSIHANVCENEVLSPVIVTNALLNMYGKCGSLQDAWILFDKTPQRNITTWNAMIGMYVQYGHGIEALQLFREMLKCHMTPNKVTFVTVLSACSNSSALGDIHLIHTSIVKFGFESDVVVETALINAHGKCGSVEDAHSMFGKMHQRDLISWNTMIAIYVEHMKSREAIELFQRMETVIPNRVTFVSILTACSNLAALAESKITHARIAESGLAHDVVVGNTIITMYGKCGSVMSARKMFDRLHQRDVFSWTSMIAVYAQHGFGKEAFLLFHHMQLQGVKPNQITFINILSACASVVDLAEGRAIHAEVIESGLQSLLDVDNVLINMYGKCGSLEDAKHHFDKMHGRDVVSWTCMIGIFTQHGYDQDALQLLGQMQLEGMKPNCITFISVLSAFSSPTALMGGKTMHDQIVASGFESESVVQNALLNMYSKCGSVEDAGRVFGNMHQRDVVSWTSMMSTYSQHGHDKKALQLFQEMQLEGGLKPNELSFISVLFACNHLGLVDEGLCYLKSMTKCCGIPPTASHHACIIDLFGRAGCLDEAEGFIYRMPMKAGNVEWLALLVACRNYSDVGRGERAAEQLLKLDLECPSVYAILSNIYTTAGRWDDVAKLREVMEEKGIKEEPLGCSLIDIDNLVHEFVTGDMSHPQMGEIITEVDSWIAQMEEEGYTPDTMPELHLDRERKEQILCLHTDKLAIAFGLIKTTPRTILRITYDLRMCSDCHILTKFISKYAGREIILRDANCFHHFKEGICSCGDYW